MFTENQYYEYFQSIATANKNINGCFTNPEQIFGRNVQYPCMLIGYDGSALTGAMDNCLEAFKFKFWIMKPAKAGDPDNEREVKEECKKIAMQVITRIRKDASNRASLGTKKPVNLDINSIRFNPDGPFTDNVFATECSGQWLDPLNLAYDTSQWEDS